MKTVVIYLLIAHLSLSGQGRYSYLLDQYGREMIDCYWTSCLGSCVDGTTQLAAFSRGANSDYAKRNTDSCVADLLKMKLCCSNRALKGNFSEKCEFGENVNCKAPKRNIIADDSTNYLCCDYDFLNATLVAPM